MSNRQLFATAAEQSVIGALLLNNAAYERIGDRLTEADFYHADHREIYRRLVAIIGTGKSADVVVLEAALARDGMIDSVGGMEYLGQCLDAVPTAAGIENYAQVIIDRRMERQLLQASETMSLLATGTGDVQTRLDQAQSLVFALTEASTPTDGVEIGTLLGGWVADLEERYENGNAITGLATGLKDLDDRLCGLQNGDLIIVAGRPSMGKTALGMQFGTHAALAGKVVQVYSMEMPRKQLVERSVANVGRIDNHKLRTGKLEAEDFERVSMAVGKLHETKLIIDDTPGLSIEQMRARSRRVKRKQGRLDLVVVDYIQLMPGIGDNRNEQVSSITRGLKLLARELNCPVVALAQLSRKCEERADKRPMMSDLRDSGAIEADADVIVFIYRDEIYKPETQEKGIAELIIGKQRMGEIGTVRSVYQGEHYAFGDCAWRDQREMRAPPESSRQFTS